MNRGKIIVIEGGDGAGKGSVISSLRQKFSGYGNVIFTREPGGTEIGEAIRSVLMDKKHTKITPLTELLLFCASRAQHVEELIRPAIADGKIVISDRFWYSTFAYQICGRILQFHNLFQRLHNVIVGSLSPIVIYLDVEPEIGLQRRASSIEGCTRFDLEELAFHKRVREGFLFLARVSNGKRIKHGWYVINTTNISESEACEQVWQIVKEILNIE